MGLTATVLAGAVTATSFFSPEVARFPGTYFDSKGLIALQRRAAERWPGPGQLHAHWQRSDLKSWQRVGILLGASVWHDPALLPIYRDGIGSPDERVRMAAVYGYRELLGDARPNVASGVDPAVAAEIAAEMDAVAATLRVRPLAELWLQSVLAAEGKSMPGWRGVTLTRPLGTGLRGLEQVIGFEDFGLLARAYRLSDRPATRLALIRLLEGVTLHRFYVKPDGERAGWGHRELDAAITATDEFLDYWLDRRCVDDPETILISAFRDLGAFGVDPFGANSYDVWLQLLRVGPDGWQMMAARSLFNLGGRWSALTVFNADSSTQQQLREGAIEWYRLRPAHLDRRR